MADTEVVDTFIEDEDTVICILVEIVVTWPEVVVDMCHGTAMAWVCGVGVTCRLVLD